MSRSGLFVVVTAVYNGASVLPRLLESLACQIDRDFVFVVQDGGSEDGSCALIERWASRLPRVMLESRADAGIYDAWNRALERISDFPHGWVVFLGADDMLAGPTVLQQVRQALSCVSRDVLFACGDAVLFGDGEGRELRQVAVGKAFAKRFARMPLVFPAVFTCAEVFNACRFDATYRIAGDYEWLMRAWQDAQQAVALGFTVSHMADGGVSNDCRHASVLCAEQRKILSTYYPMRFLSLPVYAFLHAMLWAECFKVYCKGFCSRSDLGVFVWRKLRRLKCMFKE